MKKVLFMLPILVALFVFVGCSDDEENINVVDLSGEYISDESGIIEILTLTLNKDNTGTFQFYDSGVLEDNDDFIWTANSSEITFNYKDGTSESTPYKINGDKLLIDEVSYRAVPKNEFNNVAGHTYVAATWEFSTHRPIFDIYEFKEDGNILIESRYDSYNGELNETSKGKYTIINNKIELDIQSICDDCYNHFTAILNSSNKTFTYDVFDLSTGSYRTLLFYAIK